MSWTDLFGINFYENENYVRTSDYNPVLDARNKVIARYSDFVKSEDYDLFTDSEKKAVKDQINKIQADLAEQGLKWQEKNAAEALAEDAALKQQIADDTYQALKDNSNSVADWGANQLLANTIDFGRSAADYTINTPMEAASWGLNQVGAEDWAKSLEQQVSDNRQSLNSILGEGKGFIEGDSFDKLRAGVGAVTNMGSLVFSPTLYGMGKLAGAAVSGLGKITGINKLAIRMYGLADASVLAEKGIEYSTAEGLAEAGAKLMQLNKINSLNFSKGMLGYAAGKTASAIPTAITMSIPELYSDSIRYDALGNVILPDSEKMMHIALVSLPHAIIENYNINPQTFGKEAAEKLGFKQIWLKSFKEAFGEGAEEIAQGFLSMVEKNWGEKDPTTGKTMDLNYAIAKAASDIYDDENKSLLGMAEEFIGGAVGGFFMNLGQGYANHSDLNMQQQYQKTLNEIASGVDADATEMEKAGIADFSSLREAQQDITDIGQQIKEVTDRINADNYADEGKRKDDIVLQKTLEKQADYYAAQLQAAAESAVNDYGNGLVILEQMNADFYQRQQQLQAAREMTAQQIADTSDNPALIDAALKSAEKQVTLGDAVQSGDFNTEQYQPQINEAIKTFKGKTQRNQEWEQNNPEAAEKVKEQIAKRTEAIEKIRKQTEGRYDIDELIKEYEQSTTFQGTFEEFLAAKDAEEAEIQKDIEAEHHVKADALSKAEEENKTAKENLAEAKQQAIKAQTEGKAEAYRNLVNAVKNLAEKARQTQAAEDKARADLEKWEKSYPAPKGFKWVKNSNNSWTLEKGSEENNQINIQETNQNEALKDNVLDNLSEEDRNMLNDLEEDDKQIDAEIADLKEARSRMAVNGQEWNSTNDAIRLLESDKRINQKHKKEILAKAETYKAPERHAQGKKVGKRTIYERKGDAVAAAEKMLEDGKNSGKIDKDAKVSDKYEITKSKFGYQIKEKKYREKTLDGKKAISKKKADQIVKAANEKLTKKTGKKGRKVTVKVVEDQSQIGFTQGLRSNLETGAIEKTGTFTEGITDTQDDKIVIYIVRNNIDSEERFKQVIAHELLHAGLNFVLNATQRNYLRMQVDRLIRSDKAFADKVMPTIAEYWNAGRNVQLEEVLARLAENIDSESPNIVRRIWDKIVGTIYKALRRLGLTSNLHKSELTDIIKGLRNDMTQPGSLFRYSKGNMGSQASAKAMFKAENMRNALTRLSKGKELFTYDIVDGKPLASLKTWDEGGRAALVEFLKKARKADEISKKDADALVKTMDDIADTCRMMADEAPDSEFGKWSKVGVDYDSQGKPYFTVVRQNGDYAMNIDFSTVCKKRRALNNVLNEIVKRGYLTEHGDLTQKDIVDIQEAIKNHGFEVACALCFVDSKRYNIGNQAKNIVGKWNKMYKSFQEGTELFKKHLADAEARIKEGKKAKNQEQRIALAINSEEKNEDGSYKYRRPLTVDWLISSGSREMIGGHDNLAKNYPRIFEVLNGYGSGKSKNSHMDVPWNNDIINAFAAINNPNVTDFNADKAKSIGGVRLQSFSDFIPTMFFDYVQCIGELAAKNLTAHCYTKESDFVKLFGSCGIKTNMSLVYGNKGCQKISKSEYDRIRKEKGDAFVTAIKDKGKTVYYEYLYTDLDPEHPQSFNPTEAFMLREDPRYADNCGTIAVAVSEEHLKVLLADPRIDMVIPYHKSGISKEVAAMRNINEYVDFTKKQTERDNKTGYLLNDKKTEHKTALKESGAYGKHFDFYGDLENTKDPRQTAKNYKQWCIDNDLTPKFNDYIDNENYYKLLADFKLYKQDKNGKEVYVPQNSVKLKLNKDYQQVLSNALDVNQKVADRFAGDIDNLLQTCKQILDTNLAESKQAKKAEPKTSKGKKAVKFNTKKGTYTVADNYDATKIKPSKAKLFKTNKKTGIVTLKNTTMFSLRTSEIDKQLTPAQFKNRDKNNAAKPMGNLVTLQGSAIKRYKGIVGKEVSGQIYVHKNYASEVIPSDLLSKAENIIKSAKPEFKYNCVMYDKNKNTIRFDEADNFDTAPEPIPANTVTVDLNSGKVSKQDYISKIWHHKWLWVKDDYKGFNLNESWERSRSWLNGIANLNLDKTHPDYSVVNRGIANGAANGYGAWNAQLKYFGLDNLIDEENNVLPANAPKANSKTRYSLRSVEPVYPSSSSWYRGKTLQEYKKLGYPIYETVPADVLSEEQRKAIKSKGGASGTANTSTKTTYTKLFTWLKEQNPDSWQNMRILDASSGLGQGTVIGQDMGFNVTDIEPFVSDTKYGRKAGDRPAYEDYDKLEKDVETGKIEKFDFIISNAVLNVLPQDERDNMTTALSHLVKNGGQIFFNVISKDYQTAKDAKEPIGRNDKGQPYWQLSKSGNPTGSNLVTEANGDTGREIFVWSSNSPQKVFSKPELTAYLKDVMGNNITVGSSPKGIGMTAVVVTKGQQMFSLKSTDTRLDGQQWQQDALVSEYPETAKIISKINYYKQNPESIDAKTKLPLLYSKLGRMAKNMKDDLARSIAEDIVFNNTERFKDHTKKFSPEKGFDYIPRTLAMMAEDVTNIRTGYENVPDSLLGFSRSDRPQKGYDEQKYKYVLDYYYSVDNGKTWNKDSIKGMNKKQAIERAKRDLPKALIRIPSKSDVRLSLKTAQSDAEYMKAVENDDMETAQQMVDEAAKAAGYNAFKYHQTDADNIHVFDIGIGTHGGTDSQTPYGIFTKSTKKDIGLGKNQMPLFVRRERTLFVRNRDEIKNKIPAAVPFLNAIEKIDKEYGKKYEEASDREFEAIDKWSDEHPEVDLSLINVQDFHNRIPFKDSKEVMDAHREFKAIADEWNRKTKEQSIKSKEAITQYLRDNGYDSMYIMTDAGSWGRTTDSLILLDPEQVKSADPVTYDDEGNVIPLSERFNQQKKDIRYSLKSTKKSLQQQYKDQLADAAKRIAEKAAKEQADNAKGIKARAADYLDRAEYNWADRRFYLRKWQENIEEALKGSPLMASLFDGDNLKDDVDISALWDTIDGRIQTNRDEFTNNYWNRFYDMATDNKVTYDDLNRYLFARHAEERDAYIASINPEFANGGHGSGWDDSWGTPDSEKKRLEKKYGYQLMRDIGVAYDEMTQALVDKQLEYHLISKTTADMLKNRYKHYVPLKRFDDAERHGYVNNPAEMNIGQKLNARAYGRESEPEHMLTFAKANIDTVFRRGERNMVKLAMLNLALRLNDANIQVDRQLVKRTLDRNGDVTYAVDRSKEAKEQTIYITKGDATYSVTFHNKELYNAFISDDMTSGLIQSIVHGLRGITGIMGSNATSRNIEFGLVNLTKDQQQALAENLVYRGKGKTWYDFAVSAIKNIPVAAKTFLKHSVLKSDLAKQYGVKVQPDADTRMFEEFLRYGGTTGYIDIYRLTDDARKLEQQMDEKTMTFLQRWNKWKKEGRLTEKAKAQAEEWIARVMAPLEFINDLFEQTTRFSNYRAARQAGLSPLKAAELSKNLTLNFNRHGALWTSKFNWAYMFSNASLQGTNKTLRMYQKAFSDKAAPEEKRAARYILTLSLGAGIMTQILARAMSGDDDKDKLKYYDKLDASIKDNNIVIMLGGNSYVKIPLFVGAAFPYMMGRNATALMDGTQSIGETVTNIVQNMADYFSPLGNAADNKEGNGSIVKSIMPTALRPFLDVSYNSNFAGSRIYAASYNSTKPAHTRAFNKTPEFYVGLSRLLNRMTGGNNVEKGYMDIPPEAIQHIVESYLGGTGKFFGRGYDTFAKIISGETPNLGNVPFVRRFADTVGDAYVYDEFKNNEALYTTLTAAKESEDEEVLTKYPYYRKYIRKMKELKHRINSAKDSDRLDRIKEANAALREIKNNK